MSIFDLSDKLLGMNPPGPTYPKPRDEDVDALGDLSASFSSRMSLAGQLPHSGNVVDNRGEGASYGDDPLGLSALNNPPYAHDQPDYFAPPPLSPLQQLLATPGAAESFAQFDAGQQPYYPGMNLPPIAPHVYPQETYDPLNFGALANTGGATMGQYTPPPPMVGPSYEDFGITPPQDMSNIGDLSFDSSGPWWKRGFRFDRALDDYIANKVSEGIGGVIPGNSTAENLVSSLGGEAMRPTSWASMGIPALGPEKVGSTALRMLANAGAQGGANTLQDLALGRTDPTDLAMSFGLGGALGGGLPEIGTGVRALRGLAESPTLKSERGALKLGPGEEPVDLPTSTGPGETAGLPAAADNLPAPSVPQTAEDVARIAESPAASPESTGAGLPPEKPPTAVGAPAPGQPPPPTIPEIEARSKPLTPEQRARITRPAAEAAYAPDDFTAAADRIIKSTPPDNLQKLQDLFAKMPVLREGAAFMEPISSAVGKAKAGEPIPLAMVKRDLYASVEKSRARVAVMGWMSEHGQKFGLTGKGIARRVEVRAGADIPAKARGRLDDIIEHPEDYKLTPEQTAALEPLVQSQTAVLQRELEAGLDIREVQDAYVARVVTKTPKGMGDVGGGGRSLASRPGHAKLRAFPDVRSGIAAGFEYASPIEAIVHRLETGVDAIAGRRTLEQIRTLGEKPSERVGQNVRDAYLAAKEAYKAARTPANADLLDQARRDLRGASTRANQPRVGEVQAFGRIFPESVTRELAKYTDIKDPSALEQFFAVQRASATSSDLSALFIQGGNLAYRNPVAWAKAAGYSVIALARDPISYVTHNADVIDRWIKAGAINPPSEFLLRGQKGFTGKVGRLPIIKQTQRSFEWFTFVGQTEWAKAVDKIATTDAKRAEYAAVIRKGTGTMLRPGLTTVQRRAEVGTFFAGRFLMAVNGVATDALRGGVRGTEARKTMGMLFGGATALTIAGQLATDGTMPNLTDPNNRDKPWLSIKRPGGTVNLFGPLYPYLKAYASIGQNLAEGNPRAALSDARFLAQSRLSLPITSMIDLYLGHDVVGGTIDRTPQGLLKYLGERFVPISERNLADQSAQQAFPEGNAQILGLRANPASEFRQQLNAGEKFIADSDGDLNAAYDAAIQAGNTDAADGIKYQWRQDFEKRAKPLGLTVTPGAFAEVPGGDPLSRTPQIEIASVNDKWKQGKYGDVFASELKIPAADSYNEQRTAFIDQHKIEYMKTKKVTEPVAYDALVKEFDGSPIAKSYKTSEKRDRLVFWYEHPDLLHEAWLLGLEELNEDERKILTSAATK